MKRLPFLFLFTSLISSAFAEDTQFEKLLKSNKTYNNIVNNITSTTTSGSNAEGVTRLKASVNKYIAERQNPSQKASADEIAQYQLDSSSCINCPGYLTLTGNITKIVERLDKGDKIAEANQAVLDTNNLKFLYYASVAELPNGRMSCMKFGEESATSQKFEGTFKKLAEQVFDLPNINQAQLIPAGGLETVYLYRGKGTQRNVIIELRMRKDGKAQMTYYQYTPSSAEIMALKPKGPNAIDMILEATKKEEPTGDNFIAADIGLKVNDSFLPNDLSLIKAKTTSQISDNLLLQTKTKVSYNEQNTEMALTNAKGENWVVVNATNKTQGDKQFITVVPMTLELDAASALKFNGAVKQEINLTSVNDKDTTTTARTISMGLTDHNTKYVDLELYSRSSDGYQKVTVSNEFKAGAVGTVGAKYETDSAGMRAFSLQQSTDLGSGYGKLSTEFGTSGSKTFVGVKHEVAFKEATTLSLGARVGDREQTTLMFQFKTKF